MLIFRRYELIFGFVLGIAIFSVGEILSSSSVLQSSQTEEQQSPSHASSEESEKLSIDRRIARYTMWLAAFTGILAVSTIFLWWATRNAAKAAKAATEHIPRVERAYIVGGGPWQVSNAPQDIAFVSIGNYGKTGAILKCVEFGFCKEEDFPPDGVVSELLNAGRLIPGRIINTEDVLPPGAGPKALYQTAFPLAEAADQIFFGRFTYSIFFDSDVHFSTFKLKVGAEGRGSFGLPGSYSDWK